MYQFLAIAAAVVIGLIALSLVSTKLRNMIMVAGSVIFGAIMSFVSGELSVSWAYLAFDVAQVLI